MPDIGWSILAFFFILGAINLVMISWALFQINQTLQRIIKRWAALDNIGLFSEIDPD
jgi:hypothetical protein